MHIFIVIDLRSQPHEIVYMGHNKDHAREAIENICREVLGKSDPALVIWIEHGKDWATTEIDDSGGEVVLCVHGPAL